MAYSVPCADLRRKKWSSVYCASVTRGASTLSVRQSRPPVRSAANVSVDHQNIPAIHSSGGSQDHTVWRHLPRGAGGESVCARRASTAPPSCWETRRDRRAPQASQFPPLHVGVMPVTAARLEREESLEHASSASSKVAAACGRLARRALLLSCPWKRTPRGAHRPTLVSRGTMRRPAEALLHARCHAPPPGQQRGPQCDPR